MRARNLFATRMQSPIHIDPAFWIFVTPLLIIMLWGYTRSPEHWLRRFFWEWAMIKSKPWNKKESQDELWDRKEKMSRFGNWMFWLTFFLLCAGCILCFAIWIGWLENGPFIPKR